MLPISIIVPYYRGSVFLPGLVESLTSQDAADVIVVVDGGQERGLVERELAAVSGLRVFETPVALGTAGARNYGASRSTQPWITFLDQDDIWAPHFLAELFSEVTTDVLAYDNDVIEVHGNGDTTRRVDSVFEQSGWTRATMSRRESTLLLRGFPMVKLLLKREAFLEVEGYRSEIYAVEDFDLVWRLVASGKVISFTTTVRGSYTVRPGSTTGRIAAGEPVPVARAMKSWWNIWLNMTRSRGLPVRTRLGAAASALQVLRRMFRNRARRALDVLTVR
jgi:glycosyltransferase involved in cell wall biosynthesis